MSARPADGASSSDDRFGVMTHFAQGWDPSLIPQIAAGGITQVRDELYWQAVEPHRGDYVFPPAYDRYMAGLESRSISPLIVLSFANTAYDGGATPHTAAGLDAFANYAVAVLRHYGQQIKAVEIWNEYNGSFVQGPALDDRAGTYRRMLAVAYTAIKQVRPDVLVVAGATSGVPLPYWEKLLAGGVLDSCDVLSIHPYRYDAPPEGMEDEVAELQVLVRKYNGGLDRPIWATEFGWYEKRAQAPGDLIIDPVVQARFLVRATVLLLSADVRRAYWYLLRDYQEFTMGLLRGDAAQTPKPAYLAMANMVHQLRGARWVEREPAAEGVYSFRFERATGEPVRVVWAIPARPASRDGATAAFDVLGRPLVGSDPLALDDSPVFLVGPWHGLPTAVSPSPVKLADSAADFGRSECTGWSYGTFAAGGRSFEPLTRHGEDDWKYSWTGKHAFASVSAREQHPSADRGRAITTVRRWCSSYEGRVWVRGRFRCTTQGDGVGVAIWVDGQRIFRKHLGGGNPVVEDFNFAEFIHVGSIVDFAVDPGPGTSIDFDSTVLSARIFADAQPAP